MILLNDQFEKHYTYVNEVHGMPLQWVFASEQLKFQFKAEQPLGWLDSLQMPLWTVYFMGKGVGDDFVFSDSPECDFINEGEDRWVIQRDFVACFKPGQKVQLYVRDRLDDGVYNFLRFLLPRFLIEKRQVLLHSSAVAFSDQEAYLFLGPSDAGKTTISSLAQPEGKILGDGMNIIGLGEKSAYVTGAVIGQTYQESKSVGKAYPLKKVFWLKQASENSIEPISGARYLQCLLASSANLFWQDLTRIQATKVQNVLMAFMNYSEGAILSFKKDQSVWEVIREKI